LASLLEKLRDNRLHLLVLSLHLVHHLCGIAIHGRHAYGVFLLPLCKLFFKLTVNLVVTRWGVWGGVALPTHLGLGRVALNSGLDKASQLIARDFLPAGASLFHDLLHEANGRLKGLVACRVLVVEVFVSRGEASDLRRRHNLFAAISEVNFDECVFASLVAFSLRADFCGR